MTSKDNNPANLDENNLHEFSDWLQKNLKSNCFIPPSVDGFTILTSLIASKYFYAKDRILKMEKTALLGVRMSDEDAKSMLNDAEEIDCVMTDLMGFLSLYQEYEKKFSTPLRTMLMNHPKGSAK